MRRRLRAGLVLAAAVLCSAACGSAVEEGDAGAVAPAAAASLAPAPVQGDVAALRLADEVARALGGPALERAGYLAFTFAVVKDGAEQASFAHAWDRRTGAYRVEGATGDGRVRVDLDLASRRGRAWLDGRAMEGKDLDRWLEFGYGRFINDTYGLLVPFKLRDPGVHLRSGGEREEGRSTYDLLELSFDGVGLTPGDRYTLWIDRGTHRILRWDMMLEGKQPPPRTAGWEDWVERGGVWFSSRRTMEGVALELRDIQLAAAPPADAFAPPSADRGAANPPQRFGNGMEALQAHGTLEAMHFSASRRGR